LQQAEAEETEESGMGMGMGMGIAMWGWGGNGDEFYYRVILYLAVSQSSYDAHWRYSLYVRFYTAMFSVNSRPTVSIVSQLIGV